MPIEAKCAVVVLHQVAHDWGDNPAFQRRLPDAGGRELHRQRRTDPLELRARLRGRGAAHDHALVGAGQVRRRVRWKLADLRRHRNAALYVVMSASGLRVISFALSNRVTLRSKADIKAEVALPI